MRPEMDYSLYVCTDRDIMTTDTLEEAVELAIKGGATIIQLREKDCTSREFYELALSIKDITDAYEVPLIINDRLVLHWRYTLTACIWDRATFRYRWHGM